MPNWVLNKVYFHGDKDRIEQLKNFVKSEESAFDFNKIVPMPESLNVTSGSDETIAIACANAAREGKTTCEEYEKTSWANSKLFDEWVDIGEKYLLNKEIYGHTTWYGWCCENWSTKWNASDPSWFGDNMVAFDTAWSAPFAVFKTLAKAYPDIDIDVDFADEDIGSNCGQITCRNGKIHVDYVDTIEFACDVLGYDPNDFTEDCEEV